MCVSGIVLGQNFDNLQKKDQFMKNWKKHVILLEIMFFQQNIVTFNYEIKKLKK
jgi:hypothetical protein